MISPASVIAFKCSGEEDVGDVASSKELELGSKGTVSLNSMNGFEERGTENCDDGSCMMSGELSSSGAL